MATALHYDCVSSAEEDGVLSVGFADAPFDTRKYLLFQRFMDAAEAEDANEIYVERDGQQFGANGGIDEFVLSRNGALLSLSTATAQSLQTDREVVIVFSATDAEFERMRADFGRVFAGRTGFEVR